MLKLLYMNSTARPNLSLTKHLQSSRMVELCGTIEETTGRADRVNQLFKKKSLVKIIDLAAFRFLYRFIPDASGYDVSSSSITEIPRLSTSNMVGEWRADQKPSQVHEVYEKEHWITEEYWGDYVRHNLICRKVYTTQGELIDDQYITENHSIMMYQPPLEAGEKSG